MKAICVTEHRTLEVREISVPEVPPSGHVLVDMDASTITHGDKFFLTRPLPGGTSFAGEGNSVYGANGAGTVAAIGAGVPSEFLGKQVAIYKSITRSSETIGVWCERAQRPYTSCLILPGTIRTRDYCGSFANVLTVYAFLAEIRDAGHKGIIVTAGNSATGYIAASLVKRLDVAAIFLVRTAAAREDLVRQGVRHVLITTHETFDADLQSLASELQTTAVFDGVGGELLSRLLPALPLNTVVYVYGFLGGATPILLPTVLLMGKNLTLRRFANLESATVSDPRALAAAIKDIEGLIDDPLLRTKIGKEFRYDQIDEAMAYEAAPGARAVLVS